MLQKKRKQPTEFADILSALDRQTFDEDPGLVPPARRAEPNRESEAETEEADAPRPKNRLRRLLGNISLPWPAGIGSLIAGFGPRPSTPYAEEAAEAQTTPPSDPPPHEHPNSDAVREEASRLTPAQTEDQAIAEELGLGPELAIAELRRIRREFAKKNHPDRFEPSRRNSAQRRMSIANMLIDEQMRQSRSSH